MKVIATLTSKPAALKKVTFIDFSKLEEGGQKIFNDESSNDKKEKNRYSCGELKY